MKVTPARPRASTWRAALRERKHLMYTHYLGYGMTTKAGLPHRTAALIHDLAGQDQAECERRGNPAEKSLEEIGIYLDMGGDLDLAVAFVHAFEGVRHKNVHIGNEWKQFQRAIGNGADWNTSQQWLDSRDWSREYVRYVQGGGRWCAGRGIEALIPFDLFEVVDASEGSRLAWPHLVRWALDWDVPVDSFVPYLAWFGERTDAHALSGGEWRQLWWEVLGWEQDFGFARADLLRRAGFALDDPAAREVDDLTLEVLAALRSPVGAA